MTPTAVRDTRLALALKAYGMELRLWKEPGEREWGATLREDATIIHCNFEEDDLAMAKLHLLGEARARALGRFGAAELPGCDTFSKSWKPVRLERN